MTNKKSFFYFISFVLFVSTNMNAWASKQSSSFELIDLNETKKDNTESEKPALHQFFSLGVSDPEINTPSTQNNNPKLHNHYDDQSESESESEHHNTNQRPHLLVSGQSEALLSSSSISSLSSVHVSPEQTDGSTQTDSSSPQSIATQTTESKQTSEHDTQTYTIAMISTDSQTDTPPSPTSKGVQHVYRHVTPKVTKNASLYQPESVAKQQVQKTSWHQLAEYGYKVWSTAKQKIETMIKEFGDQKKTANHGMAPSNQTFYRRMCLMWNDTLIFVKRTISDALQNIAHIWKGTKTKVHDIEQCLNDFVKRTTQAIHDPDKLLTPPVLPQSRMVAYNDDRFWSVRKKTVGHTIQDLESDQSTYV